jgi:ABC-type transport system involved in cytochrome c biogenesis permease subunit
MFAYATTGVAMLLSLWQLCRKQEQMTAIDNLTRVGLSFITIGMLFGALWAKEAWGTYWSWDPKETWAAATWLNYLIYVHLRQSRPAAVTPALLWQVICFLCLQMCWWGINYLPSAQGASIHVYG